MLMRQLANSALRLAELSWGYECMSMGPWFLSLHSILLQSDQKFEQLNEYLLQVWHLFCKFPCITCLSNKLSY